VRGRARGERTGHPAATARVTAGDPLAPVVETPRRAPLGARGDRALRRRGDVLPSSAVIGHRPERLTNRRRATTSGVGSPGGSSLHHLTQHPTS